MHYCNFQLSLVLFVFKLAVVLTSFSGGDALDVILAVFLQHFVGFADDFLQS